MSVITHQLNNKKTEQKNNANSLEDTKNFLEKFHIAPVFSSATLVDEHGVPTKIRTQRIVDHNNLTDAYAITITQTHEHHEYGNHSYRLNLSHQDLSALIDLLTQIKDAPVMASYRTVYQEEVKLEIPRDSSGNILITSIVNSKK